MKTETTPFDPTEDNPMATVPAPLDNPAQASLMRAAADLARASIAKNTRRVYEAALRKFDESAYSETDAEVAAYLSGLYEQGRSAACADMAVAALRFRARRSSRPSPVGAATTQVLAGIRRMAAGRGRGKVAGVRWEQADRAAEIAELPGDLGGLRDAAIVAVASDALLRVSEIAALDVADVNLAEQTVLIRRSKTDQEGAGAVQFLGKPTVQRIRTWLLAAGLTEGALFRALNRPSPVQDGRLSDRSIRRIITERTKAAVRKAGSAATACGSAARKVWPPPGLPWWRCRLPGAGSRRTCRGVTRRGSWRSRERWQDCGMARTGRRTIPPLLESPEQALLRERNGIGLGVVPPLHRTQGQPSVSCSYEKPMREFPDRACLLTSQIRNIR